MTKQSDFSIIMGNGRKENLMGLECTILMSGFMWGVSRMGLDMGRESSRMGVNCMRGCMPIT